MQIFSKNHIGRLKRLAKKREKEMGIPHLVTLDQEAQKMGFPNWAVFERASRQVVRRGPVFQRSAEDMREAFRKASQFDSAQDFEAAVRLRLPVLTHEYLNGISALEYARDFVKAVLSVPRFKIYARSIVYHEMRIYLPYGLESAGTSGTEYVPVGRHYKPLGQTDRHTWVDYGAHDNLKIKLPQAEWKAIRSRSGGRSGFLYNDGTTPWSSRAYAERYLQYLEEIIELAKRYEHVALAPTLAAA